MIRSIRTSLLGIGLLGAAFAAGASDCRIDATAVGVAPTDATLGGVNVHIDWRNQYNGQSGSAGAIPENSQFGYFYFYTPANPEVFVKVLTDNSPDYIQLFVGGLTDLEYRATFTCGGQSQNFFKPAGSVTGWVNGAAFPRGSCGSGGSAPVADFAMSTSNPFPGETVVFADNSSGSPTSWYWTFGDGASSTQRDPTHIWYSEGDYTVTLMAANAFGSSTKTRQVSVRSGTVDFRVNLTNHWVVSGTVSVNGTDVGEVPAGETRYVDVTGAAGTVVRITSQLVTYSDGTLVPGAGYIWHEWTFSSPVDGATYDRANAVYDADAGIYFWAPIFRNRTGANIDPFVNKGLSTQFIFPGYYGPTSGYAFMGYYSFFTNSNFGYFRQGGAPNGPFVWWSQNLTNYWDSTDGSVAFDCTTLPSIEGEPFGIALREPTGAGRTSCPAPGTGEAATASSRMGSGIQIGGIRRVDLPVLPSPAR